MTDRRLEAHDYSIRNVFPRLGENGATQEIISARHFGRFNGGNAPERQ